MTRRLRALVALLTLTLTACSASPTSASGSGPTSGGGTGRSQGAPATATGTPYAAASPTGNSEADPVFETLKAVAEVGLAQETLLDPGRDTPEEMSGAVQDLLTTAAYARYVKGLPVRQEDTDLSDGSSWQLVVHTALTPGDPTKTVDHPILGPLKVVETGRTTGPDGTVEVTGTAAQDYESVVITPNGPVASFNAGEHGRSTLTRKYVLRLVPGPRRGRPYLVDSWTGTGTNTGDFRPLGGG